MKALLKVVLQRKIKQGMGAKWQVFLLLYPLAKGFAIVSITRNLVVEYLLNVQKTTLPKFSKVVATLQGMCLFKMLTQVKTPKLLNLSQTRSVLYSLVHPQEVRILILSKCFQFIREKIKQWCSQIFHFQRELKKKISAGAVNYSISKGSYAKFDERVKNTLLSYPIELIDNIIESMPKGISQVIQSKGHRFKH